MRTDRTRTDDAKRRTLTRRTARKVKRAQAAALLFLDYVFPGDALRAPAAR